MDLLTRHRREIAVPPIAERGRFRQQPVTGRSPHRVVFQAFGGDLGVVRTRLNILLVRFQALSIVSQQLLAHGLRAPTI